MDNWTRLNIFALIFLSASLVTIGIQTHAISAPGIGNTQEPGSNTGVCTVYQDGSRTLAHNCLTQTGTNDYSETNAVTVLQNAVNNNRKVFVLGGTYSGDFSSFTVPNQSILEGEGWDKTIFEDTQIIASDAGSQTIKNANYVNVNQAYDSDTNIIIRDLQVKPPSKGVAIRFSGVTRGIIQNIRVDLSAGYAGIILDSANKNIWIENVLVYGPSSAVAYRTYGIEIGGSPNRGSLRQNINVWVTRAYVTGINGNAFVINGNSGAWLQDSYAEMIGYTPNTPDDFDAFVDVEPVPAATSFSGSAIDTVDVHITNNIFNGANLPGNGITIMVVATGVVARYTQTGNIFYNFNAGQAPQIVNGKGGYGFLIANNIYNNAKYGVFLSGTATPLPTNIIITGNSWTNPQASGQFFRTDTAFNLTTSVFISDNAGYNPIGQITNPFATITIGLNGNSATAIASRDYTVLGLNVYITSSGGTNVSIIIKDPSGNTVWSPGTSLNGYYLPIGYKINFGAFSAAPTVTVFGN